MGLINVREILAFPANGDNLTDTVINGIHFNTTALKYWNYTLYSNKTLSNFTKCYLIFDEWQPVILSNGTFVNGTSCYSPILPLETRGRLGAIFGALFGLSIMFTLINLKKHGQHFLREDKRFRIVGRRWQWYWMLFVGACGMISCIGGIDVDRDYLQDLALILQSLFFFAMGQAGVAAIWEGVRHWGSWQERQIVDVDPYTLAQDDKRSKIEFYLPLIFYLFGFMSFFMIIPRPWTKISGQGGIEQQLTVARPQATDGRFKAGAIFLCVAWLVVWYYVRHDLHFYRGHRRSPVSFINLLLREFPLKYTLSLIVMGVYVGYITASTWIFNISVVKYDVSPTWPFALGYTPCVLLLFILNIWGYIDPNEDKALIQQRIQRGILTDAEVGITKKPNWWSKMKGDSHLDDMQRLRGLVGEENVHSNRRNPRRSTVPSDAVEMNSLRSTSVAQSTAGETNTLRSRSRSANRFSDSRTNSSSDNGLLSPTKSPMPRTPSTNSLASALTGNTLSGEGAGARQQTVRSMLDV